MIVTGEWTKHCIELPDGAPSVPVGASVLVIDSFIVDGIPVHNVRVFYAGKSHAMQNVPARWVKVKRIQFNPGPWERPHISNEDPQARRPQRSHETLPVPRMQGQLDERPAVLQTAQDPRR